MGARKIPTMVTIAGASEETGLSYHYLRKLCISNQIVCIKAGRKYLINLDKLIDFLNGETEETQEK